MDTITFFEGICWCFYFHVSLIFLHLFIQFFIVALFTFSLAFFPPSNRATTVLLFVCKLYWLRLFHAFLSDYIRFTVSDQLYTFFFRRIILFISLFSKVRHGNMQWSSLYAVNSTKYNHAPLSTGLTRCTTRFRKHFPVQINGNVCLICCILEQIKGQ